MNISIITVVFELYDYNFGEDYFKKVINQCQKLCEVFEFDFQLTRMDHEESALVFSVSFTQNILTQQHYMNVLSAFAQEYQISLASADIKQEAIGA